MNDLGKYLSFNSASLQGYTDYGIGIPMLDNRVLDTLSFLQDKWKIEIEEFSVDHTNDLALLELVHDEEFVKRVRENPEKHVLETYELIKSDGSYHRYDPDKAIKPLTDLINRGMLHVHGTLYSAKRALENGFCYHLGGGMHHAMTHRPGGFCMFNDIIIALRKLRQEGYVKKGLVIDTDAHKGDGTAQCSSDDSAIDSLSIHMKNGWPLDGSSKDSFIPSTYDIPVSLEDDYLNIYNNKLSSLNLSADLAIVVHGADVYEHDVLESAKGIQLSKEQCLERDKITYHYLKERGIPQVWVMAGGYGPHVHEVFSQFIDYVLTDLQN